MGVFVAVFLKEGNVASGDLKSREAFLNYCKESVEVAKRVNAKWMTVVPGNVAKKVRGAYQTANVIETLKQASAIFEPHNLTMVLEPLNFYNHPLKAQVLYLDMTNFHTLVDLEKYQFHFY